MNTIWKYPVVFGSHFELTMPKGAKILKLDIQYNDPQLWALVDVLAPLEPRVFRIIGTGNPIGDVDQLEYIDSYQVNGGQFVWHVFEHKE